jgi:predicted nucleotidyltransferase
MILENSQISIIKNYFKTKPVLKAFLFGSNARNEANENSDIDLLVELDYSEKIGLQFIQMKFDLEKLLNKSVDLVSSNGISKHIKSNIDKDKTLIYAR